MKRPWFKCEPADEEFLDRAPMVLRDAIDVPRSAAYVWADLTGDRALHWCRIINDVSWTSGKPYGVGTTRTVKSLAGTNVLHERFFRWEEGRRHSFYVEEASVPLFRRFAEDYLVEPTSADACRFTWTIASEPKRGARPGSPLNRMLLNTLFRDTRKHYGAA